MGHKQADCKKPSQRALFGETEGEEEDGEIGKETTFDEYHDVAEEELVKGYTGTLLVVRCLCLTP